jgi:F0F1-type ATP synthase assembly protein I
MPPDGPGSQNKGALSGLSLAMELPFVLVAGVGLGGVGGYFMDKWLHTSPAFTLILGGLGFAGSVWEIIRRLTRDEKSGGGGAQG